MKATLHNHTIHSDGTKTIKEINDLAIKNNFDVVAITDHDTLDGYYDILELDTPVRFIIGVEMSTVHKNKNVHVLGYFPTVNENVIKFFQNMRKERIDRCKKMIYNLRKYENIDITFEEVSKLASGSIGRPHIAKVISEKFGITSSEVFDKYIGNDSKSYVSVGKIETEDGVKFLKDNGAIVSLAHPIQIKGFDFEEILDYGFDAIEVYHPDQDDEYSNMLRKVAKKHKLIVTGGSDYHGNNHSSVFEKSFIEDKDLDVFLEKFDELKKINKKIK